MSETAFEHWVKHTLPFIELEDWRIPVVHREKGIGYCVSSGLSMRV